MTKYQVDFYEDQVEQIALSWIKKQQDKQKGYEKVLDTLFMGAHFAKWSWFDALQYAISKCSKYYCTKVAWIVDNIDRNGKTK